VIANLRALEVPVSVVSVLGDDGEGWTLRRELERRNVQVRCPVAPGRLTPTYTKPMRLDSQGPPVEMNRFDHKNRRALPPEVEESVLLSLREALPGVAAVIVADQVEEPTAA
jgi:bifunctional ADP-heptose synthase (sugar kinase/adenylyltransferase)